MRASELEVDDRVEIDGVVWRVLALRSDGKFDLVTSSGMWMYRTPEQIEEAWAKARKES